jgi:hypothetical protein
MPVSKSKIYVHWCAQCNTFKNELENHIKKSWCWKCECSTHNHLADGKNFKTLLEFERWKKLKSILG